MRSFFFFDEHRERGERGGTAGSRLGMDVATNFFLFSLLFSFFGFIFVVTMIDDDLMTYALRKRSKRVRWCAIGSVIIRLPARGRLHFFAWRGFVIILWSNGNGNLSRSTPFIEVTTSPQFS